MSKLTDKVALITGSSSGIGAATAVELSKLGARIVITGRNKDNLEKIAESIAKVSINGENGILQVVADVTQEDDCRKVIEETINHFGQLNILINNAGISAFSPIEDPQIMETYDKIMNTNVKPAILLTHLAVPYLEQSKGVIINVSSMIGIRPMPPLSIYCMSKCALNMFTKCLALELGPKGIRVNSINPSVVKTDFTVKISSEEMVSKLESQHAQSYPLGRVAMPQDIANGIAFLVSDESSFITGISLLVDGGGLWCNINSD